MKKTIKRMIALCLVVLFTLPVQCVDVFAADGGWRENFSHDSKQTLFSGDYRISSALDESKCLDIYMGSLDNNGKVMLNKTGQSNASQVFRFTYKGDGYYEIMNLNCDKYLDVDHGYKTSGTKILTYTRNNSSNQLWKLEPGSDGYWMISSKCNGLYMDAKDGKSSDGTQIQVYKKNSTPAQKWKLTQKDVTSELKITGAGSPGNIAVGKTWSCTGKITSNYKIIDVTGEIVGSSYKKSVNPRSGSYDLKGSSIDKALLFNKLKKGTYTYKITAKDMSSKTFTLVNKSFTVGTSAKTSTLSISGAGNPGTLTKGETWSCTGKITSNYKITKVVGEIVGKYSKTVKPNAMSYSLKNSAIDKALLFNKLGTGSYTYKISATDASGTTKTLVNASFKIQDIPSGSYDEMVDLFLKDSRFKNGASWGNKKKPILSKYGAIGCCAYAADFVKYVYGKNSIVQNLYKGASNIKSGDIVHSKTKVVSGGEHWIVIINRNGSKLKTAEGAWGGKVVVSSSAYTIKNGVLYRKGKKFGSVDRAYHYR